MFKLGESSREFRRPVDWHEDGLQGLGEEICNCDMSCYYPEHLNIKLNIALPVFNVMSHILLIFISKISILQV